MVFYNLHLFLEIYRNYPTSDLTCQLTTIVQTGKVVYENCNILIMKTGVEPASQLELSFELRHSTARAAVG